MKKIDAIYKRSSVRKFQDIPISDEQLYSILEAGTLAPSSGNMQPWEFIVIKEPPYKEKVVLCTFSGFYAGTSNYQRWIKSAPIILIICANKKRTAARYGDLGYKWMPIDVANAVQNMILTMTQNGISCCWVGGIDENKIRESFRLPEYVQPIGLLPLGYATEEGQTKYKMPPEFVTHSHQYNEPYFKS